MRVGIHLLRRHRLLYSIFLAGMACVLIALLVSLTVFGPWINGTHRPSVWSLVSDSALIWFVFVMGVLLVSIHLPVAIAHGITRRDYCIGAGVFTLATSLLFELLKLAGKLVEVLIYKATGLWDKLLVPYPVPTLGSTLREMLGFLAVMVSGWLVGLAFYRLAVWALPVMPFALVPLIGAMDLSFRPHWSVVVALVVVYAAVGYLGARTTAVRPRKS